MTPDGPDVFFVDDPCPFGLWCADADGPACVTRTAGWMTNSRRNVEALDCKCSEDHRHCHMKSCAEPVRARSIERRPLRLVNTVLRSVRQEIHGLVNSMEARHRVDDPDVSLSHPRVHQEIFDAITGVQVDPKLVLTARIEEMKCVAEDLRAFKSDTIDNCTKKTGKRPIHVKWVSVNKATLNDPLVRSRLTVAETRHRTTLLETDISATPPFEALRLLVSCAMSPPGTRPLHSPHR